jgi:hypothetical protein
MVVSTGSPRNTFAFIPTRQLNLIVDPTCLLLLFDSAYSHVIGLVSDLRNLEAPVTVHLLLATQLMDQANIALAAKITPLYL